VRRGLLILSLALAAVVVSASASTGALADTVSYQAVPGQLLGVGPGQRSLQVAARTEWGGCESLAGVEPTVSETATSVTVTLAEEVSEPTLSPGVACPAIAIIETTPVTVPLAAPLAGRAIEGLQLEGAGCSVLPFETASHPVTMPDLVGLSPRDARLLFTAPTPAVAGLVAHRVHRGNHSRPVVVAQRPAAGTACRRAAIVRLTLAR
jgi:hypothetical protein